MDTLKADAPDNEMQTIIETAYVGDIKFWLANIEVVYEASPRTIKDTSPPHISIKKLLTVIIISARDGTTKDLIKADDNTGNFVGRS